MQLFGRRARADSHGRYHLSCEEMAELYRGFHLALTDTYWEMAANHKICTDAMEAIRTTHISNKSGLFLKNFTALVREVYSHAHYNVQELLYEERDTVRQDYFAKISNILDVVLRRAEHIWSTPCSDKLSVLLQFAALYSLYKDVANEEFIQKIYDVAVNGMQFQQTHKNKKDQSDDDRMYDYFDQIQLVFRLRKEIRRGSLTEEKRVLTRRASMAAPAGPILEHRQSRLATKEELDEFFEKIMKEQQRQRRHKQKPSPVEEDHQQESPQLDMWVSSTSSGEDHDGGGKRLSFHLTVTAHEDHVETSHKRPGDTSPSSQRRGSFVHLPEIMNVLKKLNPVHHHHAKTEEPAPEMGEFDYKAEFEKRFAKRQSVGSVSVDLPIIAKPKPNPMDRVTSYRRRGLFNDRNPIRRVESDTKPSEEPTLDAREEQKENCGLPLSSSPPLTLDTLVPPPKPPRAHSPRTMERLLVQAVVQEATVDDVVQFLMPSVPNCLLLGATSLALLPYLYLINQLLIHNTFKSTYYSLLLSRGIVDVSATTIYLLTTSLRELSWFRDFFWHSQHSYLPTFCYAQVYFFLFAQLISLLLVPFERLLACFYPAVTRLVASGPSCISSILIWIGAICLAWPQLIQLDCSFDSYENLYLNVPQEKEEAAFLAVFVGSIAVITTSLIIFTAIFVQRHGIRSREMKDTVFSAIQFVPLLSLLLYLAYTWVERTVPSRVFEADSLYPVCLAFLSYFNSVLLLGDKNIRQKMVKSAAVPI